MFTSWKRFAAKSLGLAPAMVGLIALVTSAAGSTLVTMNDQWRTFPNQSITVPGDTPFKGLTFYGSESMAGKIPPFVPSPDDFPGFPVVEHSFTATDQGLFLMFVNFNRPEGSESSSTLARVYLTIKGTFQGQLGGYSSSDPRISYSTMGGQYTGSVESVRISGMTIDGQYRSAEITDPKQVVDPALIASVVEGSTIPASLVDAFLHFDRYSVKGDIGGRSTNFSRQLNLTLAATSPTPVPVPEPAAVLTFVTLIGGLAYRRFRPRTA
jgi:hypothetical protein